VQKTRRLPVLFGSLFVLTLGSAACDSKVKECNQVIEVVNDTVGKMGAVEAKMTTDDPAQLVTGAKEFVGLVKAASESIGKLEIKTEGLKPHVDAYKKMLDDVAGAADGMVADLEGVSTLDVEGVGSKLDTLMTDLQKACETESEDCNKIAAALEGGGQLDAAGAKKLADSLEKLEIADANLKKIVGDSVAGAREFAKTVESAEGLDQKLTSGAAALDAAAAQEDAVVDAINGFCGAT
jgi:ABC-type transporter Mla subunit MlaD